MPTHDYSARDALNLLLSRIAERDTGLRDEIRAAINTGKDVDQEDRRGRRRARVYRQTVRYTDEEALAVALGVLRAHFVEQALFANAALEEFRLVSMSIEPGPRLFEVRPNNKLPPPRDGQQKL